ncbi:MAG: transglycosylase domain-containing protein [Antricoccus sp.]
MLANTFRRPSRPLTRRLKITRAIALTLAALLFAGTVLVGYTYKTIVLPQPDALVPSQYSTLYYSDGQQEIARLGSENRTVVTLDKVPDYVQKEVLSAENRGYYTDPGFSPSGILRALWTNITQGTSQGGSTITQQYVKNAFLTDEKTLSRKFKELLISIKLETQYSKAEILGSYLNTIYFGRGAYGIEAAAEVYFGKTVDQLTPAEGAVLASSIRSPAGYDPQNHPDAAKERWNYVLDGMVSQNWMSKSERDSLTYPQVQPIGPGKLNQATGPEGVIVSRVKDELATLGYSGADVFSKGLKVYTTINKQAEDQAIAAVQQQLDGQPANLVPALVSMDPNTGGILAYYGNSQGTGFDYAGRGYRQPGSAFKPFVLAAALENGYSVNSLRNGSSPQTFPDRPQPVRNSGGEGCSSCTLKTAITESLNTTFYGLTYDLGGKKVADMAHLAGIGKTNLLTGAPTLQEPDGAVASGIGIGQYEVTVADMASAFSTFADGGMLRTPHMISKITDASGKVLYQTKDTAKQVIPQDVANDVSYALTGVAAWSNDSLAAGRPSAAKTGTVQLGDDNNKDAWMVGYTPQVVTAVWVGTAASDPIINASGQIIYGAGIPGKIWQQYMNSVLDGQNVMSLPSSAVIKATKGNSGSSGSSGSGTAPKTTTPPQSTSNAPAPAPAPDPAPSSSVAPPPSSSAAPPPSSSAAPPPSSSAAPSIPASPSSPGG